MRTQVRSWQHLLTALSILMVLLSCRSFQGSSASHQLSLPQRSSSAPAAATIVERVEQLSVEKREQVFVSEFLAGNTPKSIRNLAPITIIGTDARGKKRQLRVWVTRDYLSIGSDKDSLRIPLSFPAAKALARATNTMLPSRKLVNEIYKRAAVKLQPRPLPPTHQMNSLAYYVRHNDTIEYDLRTQGVAPGQLTAGHMKDVVISARLDSQPERVAIYGWHRSTEQVIQPLSLVHAADYFDYSHGVRLVHETAELDGKPISLSALYNDANLRQLVSDESVPTYTTASR